MTLVLFLIVYVFKYDCLYCCVGRCTFPAYFFISIYSRTFVAIFEFFFLVISCNFVEMFRINNSYGIICIAFSEKLHTWVLIVNLYIRIIKQFNFYKKTVFPYKMCVNTTIKDIKYLYNSSRCCKYQRYTWIIFYLSSFVLKRK